MSATARLDAVIRGADLSHKISPRDSQTPGDIGLLRRDAPQAAPCQHPGQETPRRKLRHIPLGRYTPRNGSTSLAPIVRRLSYQRRTPAIAGADLMARPLALRLARP
jgi:hypothetical protein